MFEDIFQYLDLSSLRLEIIKMFEDEISHMTKKEANKKKNSLNNLSPNQMLKELRNNSELGQQFMHAMISKGIENSKIFPTEFSEQVWN